MTSCKNYSFNAFPIEVVVRLVCETGGAAPVVVDEAYKVSDNSGVVCELTPIDVEQRIQGF